MSDRTTGERRDMSAEAAKKQAAYEQSRREWARNYWQSVAGTGERSAQAVRATERETAKERRGQGTSAWGHLP